MSERGKIITKLWCELHDDRMPLFYWRDGSRTEYRYDSATDSITCDLGFSVRLDVDDSGLTKHYLYDRIDQLEADIVIYYREHYKIELCWPD